MTVILESKQLSKTYTLGETNHMSVLKQVDLSIKKGEFVSVMGPSGSGKSTLLYNISGMDRMTSGSVLFNGQELAELSEKSLSELRLTKMGFIFQHNYLLNNLSIIDNIIFPAYSANIKARHLINKKAKQLMEQMGISKLAENNITEASGGQLQRVAICRALINEPKIIFGDEPTGALNSKAAENVMERLATINKTGTTILLVTHDIKVAAKTDRTLYMHDGKIVAEKNLGKYDPQNNDIKMREEILSRWLINKGF